MKIAILTHPLKLNYGGILQAWALQQVIMRNGAECEVLRRDYPAEAPSFTRRVLRFAKDVAKSVLQRRVFVTPTPAQIDGIIYGANIDFIDSNVVRSHCLMSSQDMREYVAQSGFDAIVVGSDQVWRPDYTPCVEDYFLEFANGVDIRRIAFSASFGLDEWIFTEEQTAMARSLMPLFTAVGVREKSGVDMCRRYLGVDATHTIDPTLLLDADDYLHLTEGLQASGHCGGIFSYLLDSNDFKEAVLHRVEAATGMNSHSVMPQPDPSGWRLDKRVARYAYKSPAQWLRSFADANMVVTDSFHGVAFSIIFRKPFWVLGIAVRGLARINSLLEQFGLEKRLVTDANADTINWAAPINWESVQNRRFALQKDSLHFLLHNLNLK